MARCDRIYEGEMKPGLSIIPLTVFGQALEDACVRRTPDFTSTTHKWEKGYQENARLLKRLSATIHNKESVLIAGAGRQRDLEKISEKARDWLQTGVQWTNFIEELKIDVIVSTHYTPLEATHYSTKRKPLLLVHGVYSKVPPCLEKSVTVRWSDPFLIKKLKGNPTANDIEDIIREKGIGPAPYIPATRNVIFLNAMIMIWLGAKEIAFTGINPENPAYFFSGNSDLTLEILRSVSQTSPWLSEWDGRNERIPVINRTSSHRTHEIMRDLAAQTSAVGTPGRIDTLRKGFKLLIEYAKMKNVKIGYLGYSDFLGSIGLPRID